MQLNKAQNEAVESNAKATLVLAGAGTGKTRVIIKRIEALINAGVDASKIVATTFTNKAAQEVRERLAQSIDPMIANSIVCGTFHRISAIFLRQHHEQT